MKDGVPLESRMVSRSIEKAQRRVEEHHFGMRKRLLEYDEVNNEQRKLVYSLRQKILESRELKETMVAWIEDIVALAVEREVGIQDPPPQTALVNLAAWAKRKFLVEIMPAELANKSLTETEDFIIATVLKYYDDREAKLGEVEVYKDKAIHYTEEEKALPLEKLTEVVRVKMAEILNIEPAKVEFDTGRLAEGMVPGYVRTASKERKMRLLERFLFLDIIDTKWKDHLRNMDSLREGIYLRGYAQKDPKLEFKREGFALFEEMFISMKEQATDLILKMQVSEEVEKQEVASVWNEEEAQTIHQEASSAFAAQPALPGGPPAQPIGAGSAEMAVQSEHGGEKLRPVETIRKTAREAQPNDPCPCGSGKKFKKCHGRTGASVDIDDLVPSRGGDKKEHKGEAKLGG